MPEAIKWFEKAARLGQRDANLMLGMLFCTEPGYQNPVRGRKYLDRAIQLGLGPMAKPLKKSCGKGNGKQDQDPNIMIEMLMKIYMPNVLVLETVLSILYGKVIENWFAMPPEIKHLLELPNMGGIIP